MDQQILEWHSVTLANVCREVRYGINASSQKQVTPYKLLRITDIVSGGAICWDDVPYVNLELAEAEKFQLLHGDIVVARTGATVGYAKWVSKPTASVFASYLVCFRADPSRCDDRFLGAVVDSSAYKEWVKQHAGGAAQPNANSKVLGAYPFLLPPLPIQRRIASVLSAYDDLIENNAKRIRVLEEMARSLYREWFVHFRYPGHDMSSGAVALTQKPLGECASIVMGQAPSSEHYNDEGRGLPFHQGVSAFGAHFPTHQAWCTDSGARRANAGDILFSVRAPVGRINVAPDDLVIGRGLCAIRFHGAAQAFGFFMLRDTVVEDAMGGGTIFMAVTKADMHRLPVLFPPRELIEKYQEHAQSILDNISGLTRSNTRLRTARDLLLPQLLSGRLSVDRIPDPVAG